MDSKRGGALFVRPDSSLSASIAVLALSNNIFVPRSFLCGVHRDSDRYYPVATPSSFGCAKGLAFDS